MLMQASMTLLTTFQVPAERIYIYDDSMIL